MRHQTESIALAVTLLWGTTGFIHYVRKSYDDKIRVRMCHYTFMAMQFTLILWLTLQPNYFSQLFPLFLLTTVPAAAHFVTLTRTWLTNAWTMVLFMSLLVLGFVCCSPFSW